MSMNNCTFTGNLGGDAIVKTGVGSNNLTMALFSVAVNNHVKGEDKTMWVACTLFGKRAEGALPQYLKRGQSVCVAGPIDLNEWTADDGTARASVQLIVNELDLIGSKQDRPSAAPTSNGEEIPWE